MSFSDTPLALCPSFCSRADVFFENEISAIKKEPDGTRKVFVTCECWDLSQERRNLGILWGVSRSKTWWVQCVQGGLCLRRFGHWASHCESHRAFAGLKAGWWWNYVDAARHLAKHFGSPPFAMFQCRTRTAGILWNLDEFGYTSIAFPLHRLLHTVGIFLSFAPWNSGSAGDCNLVPPNVSHSSPAQSTASGFRALSNCARALGIWFSQVQLSGASCIRSVTGTELVLVITYPHLSIGGSTDAQELDLQCKSSTSTCFGWYLILRLRSSDVCMDCLFDSNSPSTLCQSPNALPTILIHWDWRDSPRVQLGQRSAIGKDVSESLFVFHWALLKAMRKAHQI